ncbi:MAG: universal stress protein [Deltaproteobacteria bacterium]|nr:universal stress protein [Deltaproteobacteria bacterium]
MFKNILIPQDGSKHSRAALAYGIWLARKFDAKVIGLYVVDVVAMEGPFLHDLSGSLGFEPFLNFSTKMREILENKGTGILKEFKEICEREKVAHDSAQDFGIVTNAICEKAKLADIIVMGRRGINIQFEYGLLGSTTEGVIRKSSKPVIIVPDEYKELSKPLLAYDGGFTSSRAMHSAAEFVKILKLPLTVLTISRDGNSETLLKEAKEYFKPYNIQPQFISVKGDAPQEIVKYYKENNHDLLFMGVTSHSRIVELVLGSTTEYVMRSVNGPVFMER